MWENLLSLNRREFSLPFNCEKLNRNSTCFNDHPWLVDDPTRGIGRWPRSVLDNSIFVHSSALSVMGVGKGDLVLVQNPDNGRKSVLRAWPANSVQGIPTDLATASHRVGARLQASSEETGFCQESSVICIISKVNVLQCQ